MTLTRTHQSRTRRPRRRIHHFHERHARPRRTHLPNGAHVAREETTTDGAW